MSSGLVGPAMTLMAEAVAPSEMRVPTWPNGMSKLTVPARLPRVAVASTINWSSMPSMPYFWNMAPS